MPRNRRLTIAAGPREKFHCEPRVFCTNDRALGAKNAWATNLRRGKRGDGMRIGRVGDSPDSFVAEVAPCTSRPGECKKRDDAAGNLHDSPDRCRKRYHSQQDNWPLYSSGYSNASLKVDHVSLRVHPWEFARPTHLGACTCEPSTRPRSQRKSWAI